MKRYLSAALLFIFLTLLSSCLKPTKITTTPPSSVEVLPEAFSLILDFYIEQPDVSHLTSSAIKGMEDMLISNNKVFNKSAIDLSAIRSKATAFDLITEKLKTFSSAADVPYKQLEHAAIKGMLKNLDPYSSFMTPDIYKEVQAEIEGKFGGLGIEITLKNDIVTIVAPIEDTPADKAGLKAGDKIIKIDGESTRDMTVMDAVKKMRGKEGTKVTLTIIREGFEEPKDFAITRAIIKIKSVKYQMMDETIGYIKIKSFSKSTTDELDIALKSVTKNKITGLILDLRNDPGGLLNQAVEVCGRFLEKGQLIVYTKSNMWGQNLKFSSSGRSTYLDFPMIVLVNAGSASMSEIVAGAIQDLKRGVILGTQTFGKGSVQTIIPLSDGSALKLTTAKYYTPNGRVIQGKGIIPDVEVEEKDGADIPRLIAQSSLNKILASGGTSSEKVKNIVAEVWREKESEIAKLYPKGKSEEAAPLKSTDSIAPIVKPTMQTKPVIPSIAPSKGLPPSLAYSYSIHDANNNRILDGGEEVILKVTVENKGEGLAKDVRVILTGNQMLTDYLGREGLLGDIKGGEKKIAEFKTVLPQQIPVVSAELSIEVKEEMGYSPAEIKALNIVMKPAGIKKTLEIISEINVDDVPLMVKHERRDDFAIVIGIGSYREKEIPAVKYAKKDAEIMGSYFENIVGIPKQNIKLMTDNSATKSDFEAYLGDWLKRRVKQNSTVFVYYAGHGAPDIETKGASLVPYEGHPDFPSKLYPLKEMYESLNKLPAKDIIVMLDSCFSGGGERSVAKAGARDLVIMADNPLLAGGKIMVLAASSGGQISSDYEKAQHGLFTYYLLRGMRGEADRNKNGMVEIGELYEYVKTNVSEKASIELNRDQIPVILPSTEIVGERIKIPVVKIR
ncbi:MAG: caspase family protein [Nitrospinae bacterium]|nr:caspase family protein [Nitrospinota bacterium]